MSRPRVSARTLVALLAFVLGIGTVPHRLCERDAAAAFDGEPKHVDALAASVAAWTRGALREDDFHTGSSRFDGEWMFGTYVMAAMGFGQVALERPDARAESLARMEACIDAMLDPRARRFDRAAWDEDAIASLDGDHGHVAYLGYAGIAIALHRLLVPTSRFAETGDAIAAALDRRFVRSRTGLLETYPGEVYPVDNTSAIATLALHARVTRRPAPDGLVRGLDAIRAKAVDPATGLLVQAVSADDATPRDGARGSGTALAAYFLAYADEATSAALWRAIRGELLRTVIGFGAVLEHPSGSWRGDVDSGPVVFGFGVSATGFALGAARAHGDREAFRALYATAHLFGAPHDDGATRTHATGGPLGDAILFAMTTAPSARRLAQARADVRPRGRAPREGRSS